MNLTKLLYGADAVYNGNDPDIRFITHKPDDVADGALFVCIKGAHADGHDFAHTAISKGAVAVVCERDLGIAEQVMVPNSRAALSLLNCAFYGHPSKSMLLIGVTGTNGKTTTACYIRNMLEQAGRKSVLIGTLGADSGNGTAQTDYTTPESAVFNHTLQEGLQRGCEYAVAEISSQALSQERCAGMDFDVAVFTNLSPEHLDYHQTMDEYARQKAKLFACAKAAAVNKDDEFAPFILSHCKGRTVTFSLQDDADLTAKNVKYTAHGVSYILVSRDGIERIQIPALGIMAVYNSMAAVAACMVAGFDFEEACAYVCHVDAVEGRLQKIPTQTPFSVFVDYAHTPAALYEALYAVRQVTAGNVIAVFGCGGNRDSSKRPRMGEIASSLADITVLTSDNPRAEDPQKIIADIAAGFKSKNELILCADRRRAIETALQKAQPGDSVLIAGKGHEKAQTTADGTFLFDDAAVVREYFTVKHA
ncbi:MAG: UDP-N-acetylmuramoyl-L-alanyl-D-glutamate--2,6-diaminopimelate ligase [Clostridia bacterium]|nr:UDP-N-acetylmuramoyl-L-alanyl-D-glutamate--2,6-diaminopimelate ligase [Clostridia bacterium]